MLVAVILMVFVAEVTGLKYVFYTINIVTLMLKF